MRLVTLSSGQVTSRSPSYRLTEDLAAQYGGEVLCLHPKGIGQTYRLFKDRPGIERNQLVSSSISASSGRARVDVITSDGLIAMGQEEEPTVVRVDIQGPLEQRSGYHDMCAGWSDGHDAVAERLIAALEVGNVVMVIDSPGGSYAGLREGVRRVQEAKAFYGRHVTAYADEMIGSAAFWWAACVADEIYGPASMTVGSIGARSAHASIAGALAKEGVEITHFYWPPGEGKIAFAPELPLSDVGRDRGRRDITIAGEEFAAAVGPRRGISFEDVVALNADALSGQMAVDAKLVDGIASLEDVMQYALALAGTQAGENDMITKPGASSTTADDKPNDEEPGAQTDEAPPPDKRECTACGAAQDQDAVFCDKCGTGMPGMSVEGDGDDESEGEKPGQAAAPGDDSEEEDPPPPPPKKKDPPPSDSAAAAAVQRSGRSVATMLGLPDKASLPQIKRVLLSFVSLGNAVMSATGTKSPDEAVGAFRSVAEDAAQTAKLRTEVRASKLREDRRERMDLLHKLSRANLPGYTRGELFVDREVNGKLVHGPAPIYEEMKLGTLRGFVNTKLENPASGTKTAQRSPFEPNEKTATESVTTHQVTEIINTPFIKELASRSSASAEQLARTARALKAQGDSQ